jgi:GNAT superfamily N-acetyltransferase
LATFKVIEHQDITIIAQMMQDFYAIDNYPFDLEIAKNLFSIFIENENLGKSYLIYNDKKVVGYFILTFIFSFEYQGKLAFLDELYLCESSRGKGIGKITIDFIKTEAKKLNVKMMYLELENHNETAQKLYIANDFVIHNRKILKYKF